MSECEILISATILTVKLLSHILPSMVLGVIVAELIVALGFIDKLSFISKPITKFSHLKRECGISFLIAFGSPTAANAMLADYRKKGLISKKEMFLASMINSFPAIIMHWRSMIPPLVSLLGVIGLIYFLVLTLIGLVKTAILMIVSRFLLEAPNDLELVVEERKRPTLKEALRKSLQASKKPLKRMILVTIPVMFVVCILIKAGTFDKLPSYLARLTSYLSIPSAGLGIISAQFAHPIAAYTVASSLLAVGKITGKEIILTLLVGDVLTSILSIFRFLIPYYVGIFGLQEGLQLMILSSVIRNVVIIIFIVALSLF